MTLLLHGICLTEAPADAPHALQGEADVEAPQGLRGQALVRIDAAGLAAYATCWSAPTRELSRADLLEHHRLVDRLHRALQACLPARLPTWFADETAVRSVLARRADEFATALARVRGRVELAVTVLGRAPAPEGEPPGTAYLRGRLRTRQLASTLTDQVRAVIGDRDVHEVVAPRAGTVVSLAVLVARADAAALEARLRAALRARHDVRILINGPWPPYTFAVVQPREA